MLDKLFALAFYRHWHSTHNGTYAKCGDWLCRIVSAWEIRRHKAGR